MIGLEAPRDGDRAEFVASIWLSGVVRVWPASRHVITSSPLTAPVWPRPLQHLPAPAISDDDRRHEVSIVPCSSFPIVASLKKRNPRRGDPAKAVLVQVNADAGSV